MGLIYKINKKKMTIYKKLYLHIITFLLTLSFKFHIKLFLSLHFLL